MNAERIALVQKSFELMRPSTESAATVFYDRLFELEPSLRPLFPRDLQEQGRKLMNMIDFIVDGLDEVERILPPVQALGRRHAGYGAKTGHYAAVIDAFLWTLKRSLGNAFTPEAEAAWIEALNTVASEMIENS